MTRSPLVTLAALAMLLGTPAMVSAQDEPQRPRITPSLITNDEIEERAPTAQHAQEIIERLRPQWLRPRRGAVSMSGMTTVPAIRVYLNDIRQQGGTDVLRTILRDEVTELRFVNGVDASARYGVDHELGAILVRTRRQ
jgi:hypothetical protein